MTIQRVLVLFVAVGIALVPLPAAAAPVTFTYSGTINFVDASLAGTFAVGQTISSTITFESLAPDSLPLNTALGAYNGVITNVLITTGGYTASSTNGQMQVFNNSFAGGDRFAGASFAAGVSGGQFSLTGANVNGLQLLDFGFSLVDPTGTSLASDALPTSVNLAAFNAAQSGIGLDFGIPVSGQFPADFHPVRAVFTSFAVSGPAAVPEPGTLSLFGAALTMLGIRILRRRRSTM